MCGRYTLTATPAAVARHFELAAAPELAPRYNIAPTQPVPVVRTSRKGERRLELRVWGLVPHWARDPALGPRLINARCESVATRSAFRDAFRRRRCLVPADGFYEWQARPKRRRPHHLHLAGNALFAFAGLYERWRGAGEDVGAGDASPLDTCTVITTAADERVGRLHDRMPVILDPAAYAAWLDPERNDPDSLLPLLAARHPGELHLQPVGLRVNDPRNDDPDCLEEEPDEPSAQQELF